MAFVAVHVGAGAHASSKKQLYLDACEKACLRGIELLKFTTTIPGGQRRFSSREIVEAMIAILEDAPITNAGTGSNLSLEATVECDASIMDGTTLGFGAVGAVSDFKNPIRVASRLLQASDKGLLSLGRIPPMMLVGPGAKKWMDTMGYSYESGGVDNLVTEDTKMQYLHFQELLTKAANPSSSSPGQKRPQQEYPGNVGHATDGLDASPRTSKQPRTTNEKRQEEKAEDDEEESLLQDTVGAICVDHDGRVAAGVSSGGIALKFPGRIGEAALYGAGCWAQDPDNSSTHPMPGFACSVTGAGEQITKTLFAKACHASLCTTTTSNVGQTMERTKSRNDTTSPRASETKEEGGDSEGEDDQEETVAEQLKTLLDRFECDPLLRIFPDKYVGVIAVRVEELNIEEADQDTIMTLPDDPSARAKRRRRVEFVYGHTTKTMGLGFMSTRDTKPTVVLSQRKADGPKVVSSRLIRLHA